MCGCLFVCCLCVCVYVYEYVYLYMCMCMCVCLCVCVHIRAHAHVRMCIRTEYVSYEYLHMCKTQNVMQRVSHFPTSFNFLVGTAKLDN